MAELLIRINEGPEGHDRGDVIDVQEDGFLWGDREALETWVAKGNDAADWPNAGKIGLIKVPGLDPATLQWLLEGEQIATTKLKLGVRVDNQIDVRNRKNGLDLDGLLTAKDLRDIADNGFCIKQSSQVVARSAAKPRDIAREDKVFNDVKARMPDLEKK